jgi:DNA-binding protein Fis
MKDNTPKSSSLNLKSGLSFMVEEKLEKYFKDLNGNLPSSGFYDQIIREVERPLIKMTLKIVQGNKVKAAKILGINRNTLRKKMLELGLK